VIHSSSQGLKETSKTTKASLSRTHQLAGGGGGHPACLEGAIIMESSFAI